MFSFFGLAVGPLKLTPNYGPYAAAYVAYMPKSGTAPNNGHTRRVGFNNNKLAYTWATA